MSESKLLTCWNRYHTKESVDGGISLPKTLGRANSLAFIML